MYCESCGKQVPDDALYCPMCGASLKKVAPVDDAPKANGGLSKEEEKEMIDIESNLNSGRLLGIISIVCSILGLGSVGSLDLIAIICGYIGLRFLKKVPDNYTGKSTAVTLNRAGIICSITFIVVIFVLIVVALVFFPWLFASLTSGAAAAEALILL